MLTNFSSNNIRTKTEVNIKNQVYMVHRTGKEVIK